MRAVVNLSILMSLATVQSAFGFTATSNIPAFVRHASSSSSSSTTMLSATITEGYYQLEEMEDADTATTEVLLKAGGFLDVGETDGPLFTKASGTWTESPDGTFQMKLRRTFNGGTEKTHSTDMGEFEFEVERIFTGELTMVGGIPTVSGKVHILDEVLGDEEVGYFNMIETTAARLGEEEE